jgi:hypothetical protein
MNLPEYWDSNLTFVLMTTACTVAIGLGIKRRYRSAASQLFAAEAIRIAEVQDEPHLHPFFAVAVERDQGVSGRLDWLFARVLHGLVRWLVYLISGVIALYLVDWLFFPTTGRSERWTEYEVAIVLMLFVLLAVGRLRIRVASPGLWVFAFIVGFAWGITIFGVVFYSVPAVLEKVREGFLPAIFAVLSLALFLLVLRFMLSLIYALARGMLWLHRFLAEHSPTSPTHIGMAFFWAWTCYFSLSYQLPTTGTEPIEFAIIKILRFMLVPLFLYVGISLALLCIVKTLAPKHRPVGLLYLRSFARGRESERLFRGLVIGWTEVGPVYVLSGPDIVRATLDSAMLAAFLSDGLESMFISSVEGVENRLAAVRKRRTWDLRYPVEEFKCRGTVWTSAFQKLLGYCDVVLFDLRGFADQSSGTAFELFTLLQSGQTHKALLLCDQQTDIRVVERIGRAASARNIAASRDNTEGVSLVEVSGGTGRVRRLTMRLLLSMAEPG